MMKSKKIEIINSIFYILLLIYNAIWFQNGIEFLDELWYVHNHFMIFFCLYYRSQLSIFSKIAMYLAFARFIFRIGVITGLWQNVVEGPHFILLGLIGVFALYAEYRTKINSFFIK